MENNNSLTPLNQNNIFPDNILDQNHTGRNLFCSNYKAAEHEHLFNILSEIPGSFEASEKSTLMIDVVNKMKEKIVGFNRSPNIIHNHLSEITKSVKSAVRILSLKTPPLLLPTLEQFEADEAGTFINSLYQELLTDKLKYNPTSWWNTKVVANCLILIVKSQTSSGANKPQNSNTITEKKAQAHSKFVQDTKNREQAILHKRQKLEEEEKLLASQRVAMLENETKKTVIAEKMADSFGVMVEALNTSQQNVTTNNQLVGRMDVMENMLQQILRRLPLPDP